MVVTRLYASLNHPPISKPKRLKVQQAYFVPPMFVNLPVVAQDKDDTEYELIKHMSLQATSNMHNTHHSLAIPPSFGVFR